MLQVDDLVKTFEGRKQGAPVNAVDHISFEVEEGQLFTLLGPSGCGKTTTLRCIAGLEAPDSGEIKVGGRKLFSLKEQIKVRANERGLGMVFQSYAIWPHMNVFDNVAFPLTVVPRQKRLDRKKIKERVGRVLAVVRLDHLADRQATDLSGGQQQRLALARALVMEPPLLLLDEPLSNLDAKLREEMRFEVKRLQRELGITAVYVTHDQVEALAMSNVIAVMNNGKMEQVGKPREIYQRPVSRFVADFIGVSNFLAGVVQSRLGDGYLVKTEAGDIHALSEDQWRPGEAATLSIRPEHVDLKSWNGQTEVGVNVWRGVVLQRAFLGESVDHVVKVGDVELRSRTNPSVSLSRGTEVELRFSAEVCSLIKEAGGGNGGDAGLLKLDPEGVAATAPE